MKVAVLQEPGYSFERLKEMLLGVQYVISEGDEPCILAGILAVCPKEADRVIADFLAFTGVGALAIDIGAEPSLVAGVLDAINEGVMTLERQTLLLRNVDAVTPELLPRFLELCDYYRPFPMMMATADTIQNVPEPLRARFLNYLGLNPRGNMAFGLPDGQRIPMDEGSYRPGRGK